MHWYNSSIFVSSLPEEPEFYDWNWIEGNNYKEMFNEVKNRSLKVINDADVLRGTKSKLVEFTIGKTYTSWSDYNLRSSVRKPVPNVKGIRDSWKNIYKKEGYDFLVPIVILTQENVPATTESLCNPEMLALSVESCLITYFAYEKCDIRLGNTSFSPGQKN